MKSISLRFALASVSVALLILGLTGMANYFFIKKELLADAEEKVELIVENSRYHIDELTTRAQGQALRAINTLEHTGFDKDNIRSTLSQTLLANPTIFGMAAAFEPQVVLDAPYCPYYYRDNERVAFTELSSGRYNYLVHPWYTRVRLTENAQWSEPYFDEDGGNKLMATYANPFFKDEQFAGVVTVDISLDKLHETITSIHILDSGYSFLLSREKTILVHPDPTLVMQQYSSNTFTRDQMIKENDRWIYYGSLVDTGWTLGIVLPRNELFSSLHHMTLISVLLAIAGSLLLIVTMVLVSRRISGPLKQVASLTDDISRGNFDQSMDLPKSRDEVYLLSVAVNRMQVAIKNYIQDLKTATAREERIAGELAIARSIQMNMLPQQLQGNDTLDIDAVLVPAKAVGGDFYDFFTLNNDNVCFIIADVSGKGVPAALFMAVAISSIRAFAKTEHLPSKIVAQLNNSMAANNESAMFVSLVLGILNVNDGHLHYVNAGHPPPFVVTPTQEVVPLVSSVDPVAGILEDISYHDQSLTLQPGEKLFLYTDGVNESFSAEGKQFGDERLQKLLEQCAELSPPQTIKRVQERLKAFCGDSEQSDDTTMLVVMRQS